MVIDGLCFNISETGCLVIDSKQWQTIIGGAPDFTTKFVKIADNIEKLTGAIPGLTSFEYSYQLRGATGMRLAGM